MVLHLEFTSHRLGFKRPPFVQQQKKVLNGLRIRVTNKIERGPPSYEGSNAIRILRVGQHKFDAGRLHVLQCYGHRVILSMDRFQEIAEGPIQIEKATWTCIVYHLYLVQRSVGAFIL